MGRTSIAAHTAVLAATAERFRSVFGDSAVRAEAPLAPSTAGPRARHESIRARFERRTPFELLRANPDDAIERRLRRLGLNAEVARAAVTGGPALEGRLDTARIGLERILGRNELLAVRYLDLGQRAGRAVARVVIRSASGNTLGFGTGSLVSPTLLMTNNHVLGSAALAATSVVEFNFQLDLDGGELSKVTFRLRPDVFFTTSPETQLDLTIVAVSSEPAIGPDALASFGFNPLSADRDEILAGESVTIIQHPGGALKQVALRENQVLRFPNTREDFLFYETDTTPGSSGAPVFNDQWEVVALHHSGFPERDNEGRILTPDGQIWREEMGDDRIHWLANEGIRVAAVRRHLSALSNLSTAQAALRDEALNPPPRPRPGERRVTNLTPPIAPMVPPPGPAAAGATAVWSIPLTLSVTLGAPGLTPGQAPSPDIQATVDQPPQGLPIGAPPLADDADESDLRAARAEEERARSRTYFDAEADEGAKEEYYADISSSSGPDELFDALSELVSQTHQTTLGYKPMVHLYPWVDLQPDRKIKSIYSDQVFSPIELIERDFEVARLRRERLSQFRVSEAAASPLAEAAFVEALEAQLPFNCEHVVPQSWFQKKQPMKGDLHHLFACESGCNSFRNNTPYFDFADFREAVRSNCGKSDANKFEPNSGKGAVARATLYFLLRYPGKINATSNEYTPDRLQTLLKWHNDHSVTEYERHRNQAIFAVQGNRNPLIDHPDWAEHIDFRDGLG